MTTLLIHSKVTRITEATVPTIMWKIHNFLPHFLFIFGGGGGGIRTHGPLRVSGFLDRCTRPGYATPPFIGYNRALYVGNINYQIALLCPIQ